MSIPYDSPEFKNAHAALSTHGVFDLHLDCILRKYPIYPFLPNTFLAKDISKEQSPGAYGAHSMSQYVHADLVRMPQAHYSAAAMGIHARYDDSSKNFNRYCTQVDYLGTLVRGNNRYVRILRFPDWQDARDKNLIGVAPGVEGAHMLSMDKAGWQDRVKKMATDGVLYIGLAHTFHTVVATASVVAFYNVWPFKKNGIKPTPGNSITALGEQLIELMMKYGIAVDVAHVHSNGLHAVCKIGLKRNVPILCSHCGLQFEEITKSKMGSKKKRLRNLSAADVDAIVQTGGLIGIFIPPMYLKYDKRNNAPNNSMRVAKHIDILVKYITDRYGTEGIKHVAFGSDYDGAIDLPGDQRDCRDLVKIVYYLLDVFHFSEQDIHNIFYWNAIHFFEKVWHKRDATVRP